MRTRWLLFLALLLACPTVGAAADWLDTVFPPGVPGYGDAPGVTVVSRLRPETKPPGIRIGDFVLHPRWQQSVGYDDNVLGGPAGPGSWVIGSAPSLLLSSDWSRDALGAYVSADDRRDLALPAQSRTNWTASVGGSLAVGTDRLTLSAAHVADHQDRTDLDALPTDRPVPFRVDDVRGSYAWSSGPWTLTPSVDAGVWRYDPASILGVAVDQSYRDRTVIQGGMTVAYALAPQRSLVLVTRAITQDYAHRASGQPTLDSTGYQALVGIDYASDAIWRFRLLAGGEQRLFAASRYPARTAAIAEAEIAWMPSPLTAVTGTVTRSVEDAAQEGVAGYTRTAARLSIDHEVWRTVLLHVAAWAQQADFLGGGGRQDAYAGELSITWRATRHWQVSASENLTTLRGTATVPTVSGHYTDNVTILSLRVGW